MKENTKKLGKKLFWVLLTFFFLETLIILMTVSIETLAEVRLDLTLTLLLERFQTTFTSLPGVIDVWWNERNPLFLIGTGLALFYSLYIQVTSGKKKESWKTEEDLGYHGTARWAKKNEIFDKENFLGKSKKNIQSDFEKSIQ